MWLIPPSLLCPSARESECWTRDFCSGSNTTPEGPVLWWVTVSGKAMQRPSSWRGWRTRPWSRHLFSSETSRTRIGGCGVARWIALWRDSRANLGAPQGSAKELTTTAGCGPQSLASFQKLNRHCAGSKTCLDLFQAADLSSSCLTLPHWGSMRNGLISAQPPLALRTNESASSSWPSTRAEDAESCGNHPGAVDSLGGGSEELDNTTSARHHGAWSGSGANSESRECVSSEGRKNLGLTANGQRDQGGVKSHNGRELGREVDQWQTPSAQEFAKRRQVGQTTRDELLLPGQAQAWPTPAARDHKGANSEEHATVTGGGRKHMDQLSNFVAHSPQARQIQGGQESSKNSRGSRPRLNPAFVGWLQGNPWWWTNPGRINCAASETRLWRSRLLQRLSDLLGE